MVGGVDGGIAVARELEVHYVQTVVIVQPVEHGAVTAAEYRGCRLCEDQAVDLWLDHLVHVAAELRLERGRITGCA